MPRQGTYSIATNAQGAEPTRFRVLRDVPGLDAKAGTVVSDPDWPWDRARQLTEQGFLLPITNETGGPNGSKDHR